MLEGLFGPLEGCLGLPAAIIVVLHSFFAQYIERSIVYIISFPVDIPVPQGYNHCKANNHVFSIL